jgi:hypothetical protein
VYQPLREPDDDAGVYGKTYIYIYIYQPDDDAGVYAG